MRIDSFQVIPALPERLSGLREMAYNLLWSWDEEMRVIFTRIDRDLWSGTGQNPVRMLGLVTQERLDELSRDEGFLSLYDRTWQHFNGYLNETTWWDRRYPDRPTIAYFSAEFGLTECLPIYSGGLGVLAAHHMKSASDLGVPLVGVGLLYQQGYFHQYLTVDGWQQESYETNDFHNMPLERVGDAGGEPVRVVVKMAGKPVTLAVWKAQVGRVPLYLLDSNLPENPTELQDVTDQLYGGDQETRIRQEIILGIGGLRALKALGIEPVVCHMNEGHSAFLSLERMRMLMEAHGLNLKVAFEAARAGSLFTTHTPVPAGFDVFPVELMRKYFADYLREIGTTLDEFLVLGASNGDQTGSFNMAALAVRSSSQANAVSEMHETISRQMLSANVPGIPRDELPIGHVTNGVHTRSIISRDMAGLLDRYIGSEWWRRPDDPAAWKGVEVIPEEELWATHERRRERLVAFARRRLAAQVAQRGGSTRDIENTRGVLNTRALTIGFARRFATYKRATLLLRDMDRLRKILLNRERPVQIIFAGKAHPRDHEGKEVLKALVNFCQQEEFRRHAVFIEDYDLVVSRYLVQGVDVWLNTPRIGHEASGTSGMKVLPNGGLNLSIPDGWWREVTDPDVGWSIGRGEDYADWNYQDQIESSALYDILEKDIVPIFYGRGADGMPHAWIRWMKRSMQRLSPTFSTNRMVFEYTEKYYRPLARHFEHLSADGFSRAAGLAAWKGRVRKAWSAVGVESVEGFNRRLHRIGENFPVRSVIRLGAVAPEDVAVEIYFGPLDAQRAIRNGRTLPMKLLEKAGEGLYRFEGLLPCKLTGQLGYSVRVRPAHEDAVNLLCTGLMTWWG